MTMLSNITWAKQIQSYMPLIEKCFYQVDGLKGSRSRANCVSDWGPSLIDDQIHFGEGDQDNLAIE